MYVATFFAVYLAAFICFVSCEGPPELKEPVPSQRDLLLGQKAKLVCPVIGKRTPTILWYKDNSLIPRKKIRKNALIFSKVTNEDAGEYRCVAENANGSLQINITVRVIETLVHDQPTTAETVTVFDETDKIGRSPTFKHKMIPLVTRPTGSTATLKCRAHGDPTPNVTWLKDKKTLKKRIDLIYKKNSITLENLASSDAGEYTCIVHNRHGSINFTYTLEVKERFFPKPIIMDNYPSNQTVYVGQQAKFECKFISDFHPTARWLKHYEVNGSYTDSQGIPYVNPIELDNSTEPTILIINNVTLDDTGWYTCIVFNIRGTSHRSVWLSVLPSWCKTESLRGFNGLILPDQDALYDGEKLQPVCSEGFEFSNKNDSSIYCRQGDWEGNLPPCSPARCKTESLRGFNGLILPDQDALDDGEKLQPVCFEGFEFSNKNDSSIYCRQGNWVGNLSPCSPAHCLNHPPVPENGKVKLIRGRGHGASIEYECFQSYVMEGENRVECWYGKWTGCPPTCKNITGVPGCARLQKEKGSELLITPDKEFMEREIQQHSHVLIEKN